jgi:membrane protein
MGLGQIRARLRRLWRFLTQDVWDIELSSLSAVSGIGVRAIRVVHLVWRGFYEDDCPLHASALTFNTLMSIVPILALSLALARGLGDAEAAKDRIRRTISDWTHSLAAPLPAGAAWLGPAAPSDAARAGAGAPPAAPAGTNAVSAAIEPFAARIDRVVDGAFEKVENISFKTLGGVGLVLLIWMVVQVLGGVEAAFNRVWGVSVGRSVWRRVTDYLSVLLILPLLIVAASSIPVADFVTRLLDPERAEAVRSFLGSVALERATVLTLTTLTFGFLIRFMPHTRVRPHAALAGGVVTALLFIAWLRLCAALQVGAARYSAIYGSFAILPILLAWVYMSWQIVLFGAEVAFAVQNCATYSIEQGAQRANVQARVLVALSVVLAAARAMHGPGGPFDLGAFAADKRVPVRFLNEVVKLLVAAGLLAEVSERAGRFVLLRAPDRLPASEVANAVLAAGVGPAELGLAHLDPRATEVVDRWRGGLDQSLAGTTVADLLRAGRAGGGA